MKKVNWKVYNEALGALQAQFTEWDCIRIFNTNFGRQDAPVRLGVQWGVSRYQEPGGSRRVCKPDPRRCHGGRELRV